MYNIREYYKMSKITWISERKIVNLQEDDTEPSRNIFKSVIIQLLLKTKVEFWKEANKTDSDGVVTWLSNTQYE